MVVGTPRSGTTLLQRLACELPGVTMPPETHFFSSGYARELVGRGGFPLLGPRIDQELAAYAGSYAASVGRDLPLDVDRTKRLIGEACRRPMDLFGAIVESLAGPGSVLGEKTPDHIGWWRPISRAAPIVKFVVVVRDPRAVVESVLRMPWGATSHVNLAERWRRDQRNALAARAALGDRRCLLVRYEDVVEDPQRFRDALAGLLGNHATTMTDDDRTEVTAPHTEAPAQVWKQRAYEPVTAERVDVWRTTLPPDQGLDVAAICRAEMRQLGYVPPGNALWAYRRCFGLGAKLRRRRRHLRRSLRTKQSRIDAIEL